MRCENDAKFSDKWEWEWEENEIFESVLEVKLSHYILSLHHADKSNELKNLSMQYMKPTNKAEIAHWHL